MYQIHRLCGPFDFIRKKSATCLLKNHLYIIDKIVPSCLLNQPRIDEADLVTAVVAVFTPGDNTGMGLGVGGSGKGTIHCLVSGRKTLPIWHSHFIFLSVSVLTSIHLEKSGQL